MDGDAIALALGSMIGLLGTTAGLAVMIMLAKGSFSRLTITRSRPGVVPVSREELLRRLLALNDPRQPFHYLPDDRYDLRAEWQIANADWWGFFQRNHLSTSYLARVFLHEKYHEVRVLEEQRALQWTARIDGNLVPRVSLHGSYFRGILLFHRTRELAYGIKDEIPLDWGKVVDYNFDVWRIKGQILRTAVESGWNFCPVTSERHLTANRPFSR